MADVWWRLRRQLCRCDSGARLVEIDEFAVQAELVEVAAGCLDPSGLGDAARPERVEAGNADERLACPIRSDRAFPRERATVLGGERLGAPASPAVSLTPGSRRNRRS
jgi:hypothetical protein